MPFYATSSGSRVVPYGQTKLTVAFRNFANAPKNGVIQCILFVLLSYWNTNTIQNTKILTKFRKNWLVAWKFERAHARRTSLVFSQKKRDCGKCDYREFRCFGMWYRTAGSLVSPDVCKARNIFIFKGHLLLNDTDDPCPQQHCYENLTCRK